MIPVLIIGSIRYSYTAKEKAKEQGIQHLVYPRFTRTVPPRGVITEKMHPKDYFVSWCSPSHRYLAPSSRSMMAVSILL